MKGKINTVVEMTHFRQREHQVCSSNSVKYTSCSCARKTWLRHEDISRVLSKNKVYFYFFV